MHLRAEEALDLIEMKTSDDQVHFWKAHIATCTSCLTQLQDWQRIRALLKRENLEDAPRPVTVLANSIFEAPAAQPSFREVIASVVFDSLSQPALAGARGASAARPKAGRASITPTPPRNSRRDNPLDSNWSGMVHFRRKSGV